MKARVTVMPKAGVLDPEGKAIGHALASLGFGGGTMLFVSKTTAVRWELRTYQFRSGTDQARRLNHNVEFSIGSSLLF